jgi:DNA-directed RNA polymerase subunit beta
LINAEGDGVIEYVDANIITIKNDRSEWKKRMVSFEPDEKKHTLSNLENQSRYSINLEPITRVTKN